MLNVLRLLALISLLATRFIALDGNGFDPHGSPKGATAKSDAGWGLDPEGRPGARSSGDEGNGFDPHG